MNTNKHRNVRQRGLRLVFLASAMVVLAQVPGSEPSSATQQYKFSLLNETRVAASGATMINKITRSDMTSILCAANCASDCGMFHFSTVHNECMTFKERRFDLGFGLETRKHWTVGYKIYETVTDITGYWTLVFRAQKKSSNAVYDVWNASGVHHDSPVRDDFPNKCLRMSSDSSCSDHFRSGILDKWDNIEEVKFSLIVNSEEVAYIVFNGTDSDRDSWFSHDRILNSSFGYPIQIDARTNQIQNMSIEGYHLGSSVSRRFYVYGPQQSCTTEWLYTMVMDQQNDVCQVDWTNYPSGFPNFVYSPQQGRSSMMIRSPPYPEAKFADVLAIWVKINT